uniref:myb/SANT-like DNA-binding domain-containing protein 4 n=1 Tax=Myxine glutinosa TaxID=7769 RepID=UPI00358EC11E
MPPKQRRKNNFSNREILKLLEEIASVKMFLQSKKRSWLLQEKRKDIWKTITANVNSCNGRIVRTESSLKEKWIYLRWQAIDAAKKQKMTGGVRPTKECPHLELILSIVGDCSNVTDRREVPGKGSFDTQWNVSTPGISAHTPLDEPIQEGNVTTEPEQAVFRSVGAPLDEPFGKKDGTEPPMDVPLDLVSSTSTAHKPVQDFDISGLSSASNRQSSSSNVANGSERKGQQWQMMITPETDQEVVLFKHLMMTTIEKNIAKKQWLEVQKVKAILEVEKLKYNLAM